MQFLFEDHVLDIDRRELRRGTQQIPVGPQVFDLLVYLVQNRERVVTKDDLLDAVWSGRFVSESNLTTRINAARNAIGDTGEEQRLIRTVPRKGFRFVGVVTCEAENVKDVPGSTATTPKPLPLPDKPSIAVLPFDNMSGDREQEYFADGMVEEIITALSRFRQLFVIARNSTFTYKGRAVDVKQVGCELGVRYVLEGSVRRSDNRVRITAQLIEAETGAHLWADHFDGLLEDVFDLQDKVASCVAGALEPTLQIVEVERASRRPTSDLAAYDLYLRAYARMLSPARRIPEVLGLLDQAIERDPNFGLALAWAAICHFLCDVNSWSDDREDNWRKGLKRGLRALQVAGEDPAILANAASALSYFGEDGGAMMALVDRALSFNSSFARGWQCSGGIRLIAGLPDLAIQHFENALRLSPRARVGWTVFGIGLGHFASKRFEEALPKLLFAIQEDANFPVIYRYLAACYAHLGRLSEARKTVERLRAICPAIGSDSYLRKPEHQELYLSGLRLATGES